MSPRLEILPEVQRELWPFLKEVPDDFVLYGGTAVALRYGHRQSIDFDFFSSRNDSNVMATTEQLAFIRKYAFDREQLSQSTGSQVIYGLRMSQAPDIEMTFLRRDDFIGGSIQEPSRTIDNKIKIASPIDLMATKINALKNRGKVKDFVDIATMIENNVFAESRFRSGDGFEERVFAGRYRIL